MSGKPKFIIFTDLDGSLLDHYDYNHEAADSILKRLEKSGVPVIPISSKTRAELLHIRQSLDNSHPFIIENGAAVFIPVGYFEQQPYDTEEIGPFWVKKFVHSRYYWQSLIMHVSAVKNDKYTTFSELTMRQIASLTGLEIDAADRASRRLYGEPVHWKGNEDEKQQFIDALVEMGATVLQGGRFLHVSGDSNKGKAMSWLLEQYQQTDYNQAVTTIAIGDSPNDIEMLERADIALLIKSPGHDFPVLERQGNTYKSEHFGPEGWSQSIESILHTHSSSLI